ncbi:Chitinase 1, partial [Entophlyctis luteolus]
VPQCSLTVTGYIGKDRNIGDLIAQTPSSFDYLIVQYYNNIECTYPFGFNYESWKNLFSGKIYVGLPGDWISAISGGFLEAANLQAVYDYVKNDGQFAGISLYDVMECDRLQQPAGVALFADGVHDAARDDDRDGGGGTGGGAGGNGLCIPVRRHVGVCERDVRGSYV